MNVSARHSVFLVDDHPLVLEGLERIFNAEGDFWVCGVATSVSQAFTKIDELKPQLLVTDLSLGNENGYEFIENVCSKYSALPVLVLSMHEESNCAERALTAGARGYVTKSTSTEEILEAARRLLLSETYVSQRILQQMLFKQKTMPPPVERVLSQRELEVFRMLGKGYKTKRIAIELNLSSKTVDSHCANIKTKLKLHDTHELVQQAAIWVHRG